MEVFIAIIFQNLIRVYLSLQMWNQKSYSYQEGRKQGNGSLLKCLHFLMTFIRHSVIMNTVLLMTFQWLKKMICFDSLIIWKNSDCRNFMSVFGHVKLEEAYILVSKALLEGLSLFPNLNISSFRETDFYQATRRVQQCLDIISIKELCSITLGSMSSCGLG